MIEAGGHATRFFCASAGDGSGNSVRVDCRENRIKKERGVAPLCNQC